MGFMRSLRVPLVAAVLVLTLAMAACGGGADEGAGKGPRITDPAKVPSSTRIANAVLYQIKDNQIIATGATAAASLPPSSTQTTGSATTHTVVGGENCETIAADYDISVEEFLKVNRFINAACSNLRVDDSVRIPAAPSGTGTPVPTGSTGSGDYTVAGGDTCDAIASAHGVTVPALMDANPEINATCSNLDIDQVITIP